jgi:hypothetical protein
MCNLILLWVLQSHSDNFSDGLLKKTQTFWFFEIKPNRIDDFRKQLGALNKIITSAAEVQADRKKVAEHKKQNQTLISLSEVNIAFSAKGLAKVRILRNRMSLQHRHR